MGTGGPASGEDPGTGPGGTRVTSHGLFADVRGPAGGPVLLFLHGGPGQGAREFMTLQGPRLSREVRVVGLDQRGVDRSAPLPGGSRLTIADLVGDCEEVRRALGIERWAVLGHSFGGVLALRYAVACPGAVSAVVFENPAWDMALSSRAALPHIATMLARRGRHAEAETARSAAGRETSARSLRAAYEAALDALGDDRDRFFMPDRGTRRRLEEVWRDRAHERGDHDRAASHDEAILRDAAFYESVLPLLAHLRVPALLIRGGQDRLTSAEQEDAFRHASQRNQVLVFQRAGHFVHADDPGPYAQAVTAFLRAGTGTGSPAPGQPSSSTPSGRREARAGGRPAWPVPAAPPEPVRGAEAAGASGNWGEALRAGAAAYARVALGNIRREFPSRVHHTMTGPGDFPYRPRARTPVFYGSYDWHSSVGMHWVLVRLLRVAGGVVPADEIRGTLRSHFDPVALAAEAEFMAGPGGRGERPCGWGWALALIHETSVFDDGDARRWAEAMTPLADVLTSGFLEWLPKATYPVRSGTHTSSAFGFSLALGYAGLRADSGDPDLLRAITEKARAWYGADILYPGGWEPSGQDFLSPALTEAELMARILPRAEFADWLTFFLPGIAGGEPGTLFTPVTVPDGGDSQIAHLHGLNTSRAWCWRRIAEALPEGDSRKGPALAAARRHAAAALPHAVGGDYMTEHWLACYAVLLLS